MSMSARYTTPDHDFGEIVIDGVRSFAPLPPNSGREQALFLAWVAAGNAPTPYVAEVVADAPIVTSAVSFWKRTSEEEAAIIEAGISALPVRKRRLVNAAKEFWSTDEFYPELRGFLVQEFGESRASQLLAASE